MEPAGEEQGRPMRDMSWAKRLGLGALILAAVWIVRQVQPPVPACSVWELQDPEFVLRQVQVAAGHYALQLFQFGLLGLLLPLATGGRIAGAQSTASQTADGALRQCRGAVGFLTLIAAHALAALLACCTLAAAATAVALLLVDAVGLATAMDVGLALLGISTGIWVGQWLTRGWSGVGRLLVQAVALIALLAAGGPWLHVRVLQAQPLDFEPRRVTSADKRELVEAVKRRKEVQNGHEVYHLTAEQVDELLAWGIAFAAPESKAKIELLDDTQKVQASWRLPARMHRARPFLNLVVTGRCEIAEQRVELDMQSVRIGSLAIPGMVTRYLSRHLAAWINDDPLNRDLLLGVAAVIIHQDGADLYVTVDGIRHRRLAKALRTIGAYPDVTDAVAEHLADVASIARRANRRDPLFDLVVRQAFQTAARRSETGDPVRENRAAILTLGLALGTVSLEGIVGDVWQGTARGYVALIPRRSKLRERADWSRHFWVSAAITLLATNHVSDMLGLLKEELDAGEGGSGFSFGDLAADRAGTAFAQLATRDADSARAIQRWILSADTDLNELMPAAADLPEGMSDADLLARFDSVDGPRYRQMIEEIDRRVRALPWQR